MKRWGKSPPLRWQHRRHGKPRVVQGQIGGESRPGSPSAIRTREKRFLYNGASSCEEQPSGRLLEPRREPWPRGMIAARALHASQNPAYRLIRYYLFRCHRILSRLAFCRACCVSVISSRSPVSIICLARSRSSRTTGRSAFRSYQPYHPRAYTSYGEAPREK